nr:hypothetical protein [Actinomycetota bacterium]
VLAGAPPWAAAVPCAAACVAVFAWQQRQDLAWSLLPWRLVILTEGLFLLVALDTGTESPAKRLS